MIPNNDLLALKNYISLYVALDNHSLDSLQSKFIIHRIKKKQLLLENGKVAKKMYFLIDGFVRFYHYKNENGEEVTSDFYFSPGFITSFTSFILQKPSIVNIQALSNMDVLSIDYEDLMKLYDKNHQIERLGRLLSEQAFVASEKHLLSFLNDTPQDRYLWLCKEYPEYIKNIPLQYLASYLGITPETLSRIRNRTL